MYIVPFLIFLWLLSFHQGKESDKLHIELYKQLNILCQEILKQVQDDENKKRDQKLPSNPSSIIQVSKH